MSRADDDGPGGLDRRGGAGGEEGSQEVWLLGLRGSSSMPFSLADLNILVLPTL